MTSYEQVIAKIEATCRELDRQSPTLIAVSKTKPIESILDLYQKGQRDFGENYVQELLQKKAQIESKGIKDIRWHFIGTLQKNKVRKILPWVYAIHSVDSEELLKKIAEVSIELNSVTRVYLQINVDHEDTKSGFSLESLSAVQIPSQGIHLEGFMAIPDPNKPVGKAFEKMNEVRRVFNPKLHLSMGMSSDYLEAIRWGSDAIRLGTLLFGERSKT